MRDQLLDFWTFKEWGIPGRAGRHELPLVVPVVRVTGTPGKAQGSILARADAASRAAPARG
jgi:hypothetical protein